MRNVREPYDLLIVTWLRGRGRVLLSQCELTLQVRDAFGLFGDLALTLSELLTQSFNLPLQALLGILPPLPVRSRHASERTPIAPICTASEPLPCPLRAHL